MTKIAGSGSITQRHGIRGSGSTPKSHGSATLAKTELTFLAAELSGELCNVPELAVELLVHLVDLQHGARIPVKPLINSHRKSKQHFSQSLQSRNRKRRKASFRLRSLQSIPQRWRISVLRIRDVYPGS